MYAALRICDAMERGMRYTWVFLLIVASPSFAEDPCFYDKSLQLVVCPGGVEGGNGDPGGLHFNRVPNELVFSKPEAFIRPLAVPDDVGQIDQEVIRQYWEAKRANLESFRNWAEENTNSPSTFQKYEKSLDIYRSGIDQYRSSISRIR